MASAWLSKLRVSVQPSLKASVPYKHEKIKSDKEIRLFRFLRTNESDDISIRIYHVPIGDLPLYECISYTWGSLAERRSIRCDGYSLSITENLWLALKRLRSRVGKKRLFWADQICINQDNTEEKSDQVGMMSSIFPFAGRVICWLGEEDEHTPLAFNLLNSWERAEKDEALRVELTRTWNTVIGPRTLSQHLQQLALANFFARPWFRRAWTLQEICVSTKNHPIVLCGSFEIDWNALVVAYYTLASTLSAESAPALMGWHVRYAQTMFVVYLSYSAKEVQLSDLRIKYWEREAKEPVDGVYALLGIMENQSLIYPKSDYNLTEEQVSRKYTRAMLEQEGSLNALSPAWSSGPQHDISSWVLSSQRMRQSLGQIMGYFDMEPYKRGGATGMTRPLVVSPTSPFDDELELYGVHVSRISRVVDLGTFISAISEPSISWHGIMEHIAALATSLEMGPVYKKTGETIFLALAKTLLLNHFYVGCDHAGVDYSIQTNRLLHKFLQTELSSGETGDVNSSPMIDRTECGRMTASELYGIARQTFRIEKPDMCIDSSRTEITYFLDGALSKELANKITIGEGSPANLAITTDQSFAMVPCAAVVEDDVCLLMGGFGPFILRAASSDGKHRLVGEAYVHGFLDGQTGLECEELCKNTANGDFSGLAKYCLI